jgi:alcohol dehydrogenase class IV
MLNALLSSTKFMSFERLSPEDFAVAVDYLGRNPKRVALVRDGRKSELLEGLASGLSERFELVELDRVRPDPLASDISLMASECDLDSVDLVVGLGGGSVMDSAKALAMLAENGGTLEEYLGSTLVRRIEKKGRPLILVPTTAGTGSEATKVGVYTSASGRKYTLGSPYLQADAALLSGALAASMPPSLTASTGFDALSHALESIWNKNATELTLDSAARAASMALAALPDAYAASVDAANGRPWVSHNAVALRMLEASAAAGVAFSITGTALVHALSFVLSEDWHVPHGTACAFTLDDAFRIQCRDAEIAARLSAIEWERGADLASSHNAECGADTRADDLLATIEKMKKAMGLPSTFSDLGISISKNEIRARFERAFDDPKMANSMPSADPDDIFGMLEAKAC